MSFSTTLFLFSFFVIWAVWGYRRVIRPYFARRQHEIWLKKYKQGIRVKKALPIFQALYRGVDGNAISKQYRQQKGLKHERYTYGEIDFIALVFLIDVAQPTQEDVFLDLGSGVGKTVFTAALCFDLKAALGIEIFAPLYAKSQDRRQLYERSRKKISNTPISFYQEDFFNWDWSIASILFINGTCYRGHLWDQILSNLLTLPVGTRVIITSHALPSSHFSCLYKGMELMSWGMNSAYVYQKIA